MHADHKNISNQKYQQLTQISKATATIDLTELVDNFKILNKQGITEAGTSYILKGS